MTLVDHLVTQATKQKVTFTNTWSYFPVISVKNYKELAQKIGYKDQSLVHLEQEKVYQSFSRSSIDISHNFFERIAIVSRNTRF